VSSARALRGPAGVTGETMARMRGIQAVRPAGALAIAFVIGALVTPQGAQSDWKRITPVERGQAMSVDSAAAPSGAIRLIFEYDGDRVRVVQQTPVDIAPSSLPLARSEDGGVFVEVRDAGDRTLARVPVPHALSSSLEIFPERHDQPITRADAPRATGAFTVVVPVTPAADHVTIVRVAADTSDARGRELRATDLVSFPLKTP
jgi:hypothetical protein